MGIILAHSWYGKGLKKPKGKDKKPYYIPYHRSDVVGGDAGQVPMELGKTTLRFWTCRGPHVSALTTLVLLVHTKKKRKKTKEH